MAHREALTRLIARVFARLTAGEILERLERGRHRRTRGMNSIADFLDHPQLAARDRWRDVDSPAGPLRALRAAGAR